MRLVLLPLISLLVGPPVLTSPVLGPYSASINIALDLTGEADPLFWGTSDSYASKVEFHPPTGYRVRILRVDGDFISWPKSGSIESGASAEIGWGLKTTASDTATSGRITYPGYTAVPYENSFVWVQGVVTSTQQGVRIAVDREVGVGGILGDDNIMLSQAFVALNTTGLTLHMESTYTIKYQFEEK